MIIWAFVVFAGLVKANKFIELTAKTIGGEEIEFTHYKDEVVLIANVASQCKYTDDGYDGLNYLNDKFYPKGLTILAFPCNQFGGSEPGSKIEIRGFLFEKRVKFQTFEKIHVNGAKQHPVYKFLKGFSDEFSQDIEWNFAYFLVNRSGEVVKRYAAGTDLKSDAVNDLIIQLLAEKPKRRVEL